MIAIDTNILVYAHRNRCLEHQMARDSIQRAANSAKGW